MARNTNRKQPARTRKPGDWTKGAKHKDGFVVAWPHSYYVLLKRPAKNGKGYDWIAEMSDGHRIPGTGVHDAEAKARAYGADHDLIAAARKQAAANRAKPQPAPTTRAQRTTTAQPSRARKAQPKAVTQAQRTQGTTRKSQPRK